MEERKAFFSEKKKQEIFASLGSLYPGRARPELSEVFGFFFSKKQAFLA
jgi:hypothetical protein